MELIQTVGRRKTSVARALVRKGSGKIVINDKESKHYFPSMVLHARVTQPLVNWIASANTTSRLMFTEEESPGNQKLSASRLRERW